jgi:uncharacterized protein (DUF58 family)
MGTMPNAIVLERLPAPAPDPTMVRRRVYIFFTRPGLLFLITLVVMLLGAVNYTNSMAYLLTFLLGSLLLVCILHTHRNLRGLVVRIADAEPVFAGEVARFPLLFDNRAGGTRIALRIRERARKRRRNDDIPLELDVPEGELSRALFEVKTTRRGVFRLPTLVLDSHWPLGLVRAWSYLDAAAECLVWPRPAGARPLPPAETSDMEQIAGAKSGTDDFSGFRAYQPGDSTRRIDWKALAREQGLLVKRFSGAGSRRITLRWALAGPEQGVEACLSQLCRWVLDADAEGLLYALEIPGARVPHGTGAAHRTACLAVLARFGS